MQISDVFKAFVSKLNLWMRQACVWNYGSNRYIHLKARIGLDLHVMLCLLNSPHFAWGKKCFYKEWEDNFFPALSQVQKQIECTFQEEVPWFSPSFKVSFLIDFFWPHCLNQQDPQYEAALYCAFEHINMPTWEKSILCAGTLRNGAQHHLAPAHWH